MKKMDFKTKRLTPVPEACESFLQALVAEVWGSRRDHFACIISIDHHIEFRCVCDALCFFQRIPSHCSGRAMALRK